MVTRLDEVIAYGQQQPWIEVIGTEGSRNDQQAPTDIWQDLDLTYFATDPAKFDFDDWCQHIGQPVMTQLIPNTNLFGATMNTWQVYLVQLAGFERIDLKVAPVTELTTYLATDSLNTVAWSRDVTKVMRATDDHSHWVGLPSQADFDADLNEFYWCAGNVIKALARQQLIAANEMNNQHVRPKLLKLLAWQVGLQTAGQYNPGAGYRFLASSLPTGIRQQLAASYQQGSLATSRQSLRAELMAIQWAQSQLVAELGLTLPAYVTPRRQQLKQWLKLDV